jgi:aldose 1-epimerase
MKTKISILLITCFLIACKNDKELPLCKKENFERVIQGDTVSLFTLKNKNGITAQITNYGGRVVSLFVPDKDGKFEDVVLGYDNLDDYFESNEVYFGALIGRYGNRIKGGNFTIDGKEYKLEKNNGKNHLHGGVYGFHNVVWTASQPNNQTLQLTYFSEHMEEGYPGNLSVNVLYTLTDKNELKVEYKATSDAPTVVNLTHHSFFNLQGAGKGAINDHELYINAEYYTPVDEDLIPTGEIRPVVNTPMDFTDFTRIGERIDSNFDQLKFGLGYDHNWVLNEHKSYQPVASVLEPISGRILEVYTNEPGLQFYGGNFLDGRDVGKNNKAYQYRSAFCLETQHFPDSPNQDNFPSTILNKGDEYSSYCIYKFQVKK